MAATQAQVLAEARARVLVRRVVLFLVAYAAALLLYIVWQTHSLLQSLLAVFLIGFIALRLHNALTQVIDDRTMQGVAGSDEGTPPETGIRRAVVIVLLVAVVMVLAALRFDVPSGVGFFGFALLYLGVGIGLAMWRSGSLPARRLAPAGGACAVLVAGGLVALALGGSGTWWWMVGLGLLASPTVVALVSENALDALARGKWPATARLIGSGAVVLVATFGALATVGAPTYVLAFGIALVVLMLAIVARSNVDVVLVVALVAAVWAMAQQSVPEPAALRVEPDESTMVALGDSFISGEGAEEYFDGTNDPNESTCRRAPTAYPALLMLEHDDRVPRKLLFLACSGARIDEVGPVTADGDADGTQLGDAAQKIDQGDLGVDDVELVAVMVGGNDSLFGTIGRACVLPIDCTPLERAWRANLDSVGEMLDGLYARIEETFPQARIVVVPYPVPITERRECDYSAFTNKEHRLLHDFTLALNTTVVEAADRAELEVVETMPTAFSDTGLRLCDGGARDVGVNFLATNSVTGTLEQSVDPRNWVHNSMHPNARGHEAMRGALVSWLDGTSAPPAPEAAPPANDDDTCLGESGHDLDVCTKDWVRQEVAQQILLKGWIVVPAVGSAWLFALGTIALSRRVLS